MRTGRGLGVELHRRGRDVEAPEPLERSVVQVPVRELHLAERGARAGAVPFEAVRVDREPVVVGRHLHAAGAQVLHRLIGPAMSERHLVGAAREGQGEQLVTEADPEDRERAEEPTGRFDPVARRGRVPGPVRQEDAVEPASEHLGHGRLRREHRGFDPGCGETAQDRALQAEVVRRHPYDPSPRRRRRTDEVACLVRFAGADVPRQVGALHPRLCSHAADERAGVEVARRDPAPHRAVFAEPKGQPPRIDALEADDARALELAVQRSVGPPARCPARGLANDEAGRPGRGPTRGPRRSCRSCPDAGRSSRPPAPRTRGRSAPPGTRTCRC